MSDPRPIARRFYEVFTAGDFDAYAELLAEDVSVEVDTMTLHGREAVCSYAAGVRQVFPGIVAVPARMVADGDTVVVELRQTNPAGEDDPDAWRLLGTACEVIDVRDGLIARLRSYYLPHPDDRTSVAQMPSRNEAYRLADEQDALRRVATLVAGGASEHEVFDAVITALAGVLRADATSLFRFEPDDTLTLIAAWSRRAAPLPIGERRAMNAALTEIRDTGRPQRFDAMPEAGPFVAEARDLGMRSAIGVPITVEGGVWGVVFASSEADAPFPAGTEARMVGFTELAATALANVHSRMSAQHLAEEQAALRRVAELAARGAPSSEVLEAVVEEACRLVGTTYTALGRFAPDGSQNLLATYRAPAAINVGDYQPPGAPCIMQEARRTGRPVRIDTYVGRPAAEWESACEIGVTAAAGAPIVVDGEIWGALSGLMIGGTIPVGAEERLAKFAEIAGIAVSGAQARAELHGIATEQAALRRVAELVARGVAQQELLESVAAEASRLIEDEATTLLRFDDDGCATVLATRGGPAPAGARFPVSPDDDSTPARVLRTGGPARLDVYPDDSAPEYAREYGVGSSVGAPIVVEDRVWGMLGATTPGRRLPVEAERRLQQFAELVAAALANAQARAEVQQLADEQAALRRVAELVARSVAPDEVLDAIVLEASELLSGARMSLLRFREDGDAVVVAVRNEPAPVGLVVPSAGAPWSAEALRTRRALRVGDFTGTPAERLAREFDAATSVVVPVVVDDRVWGMLSTSSADGPVPAGTEERLAQFAELAGTAVANAESRAQLMASRARVVAAADESRRHLQRDVHDGAQQRLVQTVINLKLARQALTEHPWPAAHLIDESLLHAERANAELRDVVRGVLPASLARGGLRTGFESLCADLPLDVELDVSAPRLPAATETTAYFVVAEALANVVKHAGATAARVSAVADDGILRVEVSDDGVGGADPGGGSGLTGLFDRVEASEGTLVVESAPGQGTTLRATLPVAG